MRLKVHSTAAVAALILSTAPTAAAAQAPSLSTLTGLAIDRLLLADQVAAAKFGTDRPIDDPVREQQLLDQVRAQATALDIDEDAVVRIFTDQIAASKVVQRGLFARWTAHPDEAPTTRPDLTQIRTALDKLTATIMTELARTEHLRHTPLSQLTVATSSVVALRHLDALHRSALKTAIQSFCA